ncbi:RagB/SusD family nutrient uptake outer membrane protein [Chitinophaga rhizophila]|uniref:SusD/RagB family nutrient-binding outer membrane lipoprotein n=1 Tax=Chitinophaga rhizophila TaxID=2866212 RepID=A0ABS7GC71_9BACT|nr:RagB/SusD family nutrient uptake outer membrane protein [Chitinophaga rhizophila]MBW8685254.1 SusD/RagB family nutrient-binding outer membrane lipoprotein [Chitinophaga rhizophila]
MKRYYKKSMWAIAAVVLLGASACTKNFEVYNQDNTGINPDDLKGDYNDLGALMTAQRSIINFSGGGDPNSYQLQQNLNADCYSGYFMSPTPFNGGQNNLSYSLMNGWNGEPFKVGMLNIMGSVNRLRNTNVNEEFPAVWAVAQIVKVTGISRVTDIYGPIPYSKVGTSKTSIAYDSQEDIYKSFFLELDTATANLRNQINGVTPALPFAFSRFDLVYDGDFTRWLQYANSLRLRLAMHIVKAAPELAKEQAEKALDPANGGVITTNDGAMRVKVSGSGFSNPLVFIATNWADIRIGASIVSYMNGYQDPRMSRYFDRSTDTTFPVRYQGIRIGSVGGSVTKNDYVTYSNLNVSGATPSFTLTTPVQIMTAAEVYFLRAEAALRGWANAGGSVQTLYEQGINVSMQQWGVNAGTYITDNTRVPEAFTDPKNSANNAPSPSAVTVRWDDAATQAVKMERIITQKWIAMFPEGQEAWTEYRRTGYPKLFPVVNNFSGGVISSTTQIRRLPFTQNEYQTNAAEVQQAITLLKGPDNGATRLWWDVAE